MVVVFRLLRHPVKVTLPKLNVGVVKALHQLPALRQSKPLDRKSRLSSNHCAGNISTCSNRAAINDVMFAQDNLVRVASRIHPMCRYETSIVI